MQCYLGDGTGDNCEGPEGKSRGNSDAGAISMWEDEEAHILEKEVLT